MRAKLTFQARHSNWLDICVEVDRANTVRNVQLNFDVRHNLPLHLFLCYVYMYIQYLYTVLQGLNCPLRRAALRPRCIDSDRTQFVFELRNVQRLEVRILYSVRKVRCQLLHCVASVDGGK